MVSGASEDGWFPDFVVSSLAYFLDCVLFTPSTPRASGDFMIKILVPRPLFSSKYFVLFGFMMF